MVPVNGSIIKATTYKTYFSEIMSKSPPLCRCHMDCFFVPAMLFIILIVDLFDLDIVVEFQLADQFL